MPSAHGHSSHLQQRRTFRGRGGPTDGNLPPKKNLRRRVKYLQAAVGSSNAPSGTDVDDIHDTDDDADAGFSVITNQNECREDEEEEEYEEHEKLLRELKHLRQRIQQLVDSFQTSQGMGNASRWQTNCLLPTKNAVNEWRSIVQFYNLLENTPSSEYYGVCNNDQGEVGGCENVDHDNTYSPGQMNYSSVKDAGGGDTMDIINSTIQEVFGLIQMSLQVGPLSGSNPGYFKRCGGEVASMAMTYLDDIADLAGKKISLEEGDELVSDNDVDGTTSSIVDRAQQFSCFEGRLLSENECDGEKKANGINVECCEHGDSDCIHSEIESSCNSAQNYYDDEKSNHAEDADIMILACPPSNDGVRKKDDLMCNLKDAFLFTENQSTRFYQWMCNAEKASRKNKPPSKSAVKLQSLKSKKQKQKELKMERKTKK